MKHNLRKSGAIAAAAFLATSCAVHQPGTTPVALTPAVNAQPGSVTVPVSLPALDDRGVQYAYHNSTINTVEVRLRDSLGNEFVQYVTRNVYLTDSRKAGTANVVFHNVMPGTFTLTVRTSHLRLIAATDGPIKYDSKPAAFFIDGDGDHVFDPGETEPLVISGGIAEKYVVFAQDDIDPTWVFPDDMRRDTTSTQAGFGAGAATESIIPGGTTQVAVTVGQLPKWASSEPWSTREITAGDSLVLSLGSTASIATGDGAMVTSPAVTFSNGIVDLGETRLNVYGPTVDNALGTVTLVPTRSTNPAVDQAPAAWPIWLTRGQALAEWGLTANGGGTNAPRVIVQPAIANSGNSRIFSQNPHVARAATSQIQVDLRDQYGNPVAGNIAGVNTISLATLRRANAYVKMDYALISYTYADDPRNNLPPFILPGRTTGTVSASGLYTQGTTAPAQMTEAATYSVKKADTVTDHDLRITRLEVPYHLYADNTAAFGGGNHLYTLNVIPDPSDGSRNWVYLERAGGPVIASASVDPNQNQAALNLPLNAIAPGTLPLPILPSRVPPVILRVPNRPVTAADDHGTRFDVTSYGARRISDTDTVQVRVLNGSTQLFVQPVQFQWLQ